MKSKRVIIVLLVLIFLTLLGTFLVEPPQNEEYSLKTDMKDAVLHEIHQVDLLGKKVNPAIISALLVSGSLIILALIFRIFCFPRFKEVPGKAQSMIELVVGYFRDLAKEHSPQHYSVLGGYIFSAAVYIFISTLLELLGLQVLSTEGISLSLPAPLSDINAALALGCTSYIFILVGGIVINGLRGAGRTLKDFSLPISMSFRLFGAMLGGLLVTELIYSYQYLSYALPLVVALLFTLLHAFIQAYVLSMLVAIFFGEAVAKKEPSRTAVDIHSHPDMHKASLK